jgi:hypothetical protein
MPDTISADTTVNKAGVNVVADPADAATLEDKATILAGADSKAAAAKALEDKATDDKATADKKDDEPTDKKDDEPTDKKDDEPTDKDGDDASKDDDQDDDGKAKDTKDGDKDEPGGAPENYEDFKLPEGMEIDKVGMEKFTPLAKELNLTQDQAQKLVDIQTAALAEANEAAQEAWDATQTKWREAAENDKEYGGDKFDANVASAMKFLKALGTPELMQALADTGVGNHPEFIRLCVRAGNAISEDNVIPGGAHGAIVEKTAAATLFPNMAQGT